MTEKIWCFQALDTFFFRDGTPFNSGEGGQMGARSFFPPYMTTLQGAIRTTLAATQGWTAKKKDLWPTELGDPDNLGALQLKGPYLVWGGEVLLPAPLLLMRRKENELEEYLRLKPGKKVECDFGRAVRLPVPSKNVSGAKLLSDAWLTPSGMSEVLKGAVPGKNEVKISEDLWQEEYRVGLKRDQKTRVAVDKHLYSSLHIRSGNKLLGNKLSIAVSVSGVPAEWHEKVATLVCLGGEGRPAQLSVKDNISELIPTCPMLKSSGDLLRFTVTLITPGYYTNSEKLQKVLKQGPEEVVGQCVSACLGKLGQAGGWDMVENSPRPLRPLVPVGSTWFFEARKHEQDEIKAWHGKFIGDENDHGFGQILIGRWEESK